MNRLGLLVIVLFLLFAMLVGGTVVYSRSLPVPDANSPLSPIYVDSCGNALCFLGIQPGVTAWHAAKTNLRGYVYRDDGEDFHGTVGSVDFRVQVDGSGGGIANVQVQASRNFGSFSEISLQQLVEQFGVPCYVNGIGPNGGDLLLMYPSFEVRVSTPDGHLSLESKIGSLTLLDNTGADAQGNSCNRYDDSVKGPWLGFASVERYMAAGVEQDQQYGQYQPYQTGPGYMP